jgi:hypothetical protein
MYPYKICALYQYPSMFTLKKITGAERGCYRKIVDTVLEKSAQSATKVK